MAQELNPAALVPPPAPGTPAHAGLPGRHYHSPERFERELERLAEGQWLYFCHISELPVPGAYRVRRLLGESVIAIRTDDGDVRAYLNVCRHRGSELCAEPAGAVKQIVCPYHQWRYAIDDGRLLGAPGLRDGAAIDFADWGLNAVALDTWRGFVFIGLGERVLSSISIELERRVPQLATVSPERTKLAARSSYEIRANWKVVLENAVECYHCPVGHPELSSVMDREAIYAALADASAPDARPASEPDDPYLMVLEGGFPLRAGMKTLSLDGSYVCRRLLGEFGEGAIPPTPAFGAGFSLIPVNTHVYFHADHARVMHALPISIDHTRWETEWFVDADAVEGEDYDRENLTAVMDATIRQDVELCEAVQRGISSRRYTPGPMHPQREPGLAAALDSYLALMGEEHADAKH
jgi:phenylpropionate dioxygenase-like ring-hydroxylating dioxygenase large terminal subunit